MHEEEKITFPGTLLIALQWLRVLQLSFCAKGTLLPLHASPWDASLTLGQSATEPGLNSCEKLKKIEKDVGQGRERPFASSDRPCSLRMGLTSSDRSEDIFIPVC